MHTQTETYLPEIFFESDHQLNLTNFEVQTFAYSKVVVTDLVKPWWKRW